MKTKPKTDQFELKIDPTDFIEGGDEGQKIEKKSSSQPSEKVSGEKQIVNAKVYREQKVFRLPIDIIDVLKKEAYERSMENRSRVTETELVEQALRKFFEI